VPSVRLIARAGSGEGKILPPLSKSDPQGTLFPSPQKLTTASILIIGARSSGKTSFLNFLKTSLALPPKKRGGNRPNELVEDIFAPQNPKVGNFESHYLETEIDGERIGLTLWDSEGLEKNVVDLQLREMSSFLESKFEETFTEEMKVVRAPGVQDTHIHCAFLLLDPLRLDRNIAAAKAPSANGVGNGNGKYGSTPRVIGGLDEDLDLQVLRTLQGKTTVVPVIAKADTITTAHMTYLKKTVWDSLRKANLDPLEALGLDDLEPDSPRRASRIEERDEEEEEEGSDDGKTSGDDLPIQNPEPTSSPNSKRMSSGSVRRHKRGDSDLESSEIPYLPLSIISPDIYEPGVIGRKFPWGFADPMDVDHCDFLRLKEAVFSEWRGELREASRELWYEGWRTSRLKHRDTKR
jgi:septin family protein